MTPCTALYCAKSLPFTVAQPPMNPGDRPPLNRSLLVDPAAGAVTSSEAPPLGIEIDENVNRVVPPPPCWSTMLEDPGPSVRAPAFSVEDTLAAPINRTVPPESV